MDLVPPLAIRSVRKNARLVAGVFIFAALAALSGCASFMPQTKELAKGLPAGLPEKIELTETPFFPQLEYQCGPAALATDTAPSVDAAIHALDRLERDEIWPAIRLLRRTSDAFDLVNSNTLMLEHLAPADYHIVRNGLGHGSGFGRPAIGEIEHFVLLLEQEGLGRGGGSGDTSGSGDTRGRGHGCSWAVDGIGDPASLPILLVAMQVGFGGMGLGMSWVSRAFERQADVYAARIIETHAREAAKVGQYVTLGQQEDTDPQSKIKFFRHALRKHCVPPPISDMMVDGFYERLADFRELISRYDPDGKFESLDSNETDTAWVFAERVGDPDVSEDGERFQRVSRVAGLVSRSRLSPPPVETGLSTKGTGQNRRRGKSGIDARVLRNITRPVPC